MDHTRTHRGLHIRAGGNTRERKNHAHFTLFFLTFAALSYFLVNALAHTSSSHICGLTKSCSSSAVSICLSGSTAFPGGNPAAAAPAHRRALRLSLLAWLRSFCSHSAPRLPGEDFFPPFSHPPPPPSASLTDHCCQVAPAFLQTGEGLLSCS